MPPRRKRATSRKRASAQSNTKTTKPEPVRPVVGPGERLFVLSVPYEERGIAMANGARWDAYTRQTIYVGSRLPYGLAPYASPDYSWERWVEDDLNGTVLPTQRSAMTLTPRPHQNDAIEKIQRSAARGYRGFVEADDVGVGKTVSAWAGALKVALDRGAHTVLVMCPKSVIPHWRRTIAALGDDNLRVVVINYDQAKKLLSVPESAASASRTRTKNKRVATSGKPLVDWDIVLFDEAHKIKNQSAQRSRAAARIARYAETATTAPFVIWMSATIGQNPVELGYLAPLFSQLTGASKSDLKDFGQWLADEGFCVTYNSRFEKWDWALVPDGASPHEVAAIDAAKDADLARIRAILFDRPDAPSIRRLPTDIAGWPEVQRIAYPVGLSVDERRLYEQAWMTFRSELNLARNGKDPKANGRAARLRFRQKASLLRVPGTVEQILDLLENGHQVAVSVEFHETSDAIRDALAVAKVAAAEFSGRNTATRESDRLAFQRGHRKVIIFSVAEGISLHQREQLPDGTIASDVPRSTIVHDPRYSGLDSIQIEGRCHRDGVSANVYYTFAAGTVEEQIVRTLVGRVMSTKAMSGDDVSAVQALEAVLDKAVEVGPEDGFGFGGGRVPPHRVDSVGSDDVTDPGRSPSVLPASRSESGSAEPRPVRASASPQASSFRAGRAPDMDMAADGWGGSTRVSATVPGRDGLMTPEEKALREALAGGRKPVRKPRETPAERAAFRERLKDG